MSTDLRKRKTKKREPEPEPPLQRTASEITANDITSRLDQIKKTLAPIDKKLTSYELEISDISMEIDDLNGILDEETDIRKRNRLSRRLEKLSNKLVELENEKDVLEKHAEPYVVERNRLLEQLRGNRGLWTRVFQKAKEVAVNASNYVADIYNPDGTVKYKNAFVASRAIDSIATGENLSIFDTYDNIKHGMSLPNKYEDDDIEEYLDDRGNERHRITIPCNKPQFRSELIEAVENGNPPLVILVTSKIHAIIYIIHEGNKYTVGYGYNGEGNPALKGNRFADKVREMNKPQTENVKNQIAHMIEYLRGALYTADYLIPEDDNVARISWITLLDNTIINNIQTMLNSATEIVYNVDMDDNRMVSDQAIVNLDQNYSEGIQFTSSIFGIEGYNCIVWAERVLGVKGLCGCISNPTTCPSVTKDEWEAVINNLNDNENLNSIIGDIKKRLEPQMCTSILRTLKLKKGGRKTRKNKKTNNRRKRYNKTRK